MAHFSQESQYLNLSVLSKCISPKITLYYCICGKCVFQSKNSRKSKSQCVYLGGMGVLLIRRLEADGCLGQLPDFLPAMNCSGFSFMVTRWLLWLHASQPCSREKEMWEGTAFPFPLHLSSQTSACVSLARL